jgi:hypothetical protein
MAELSEKKQSLVQKWRTKFEVAYLAYAGALDSMEEREKIYLGTNKIKPVFEGDSATSTPHLRNVVAELIEAQVQSYYPLPKVSPMSGEDEALAKEIEDLLRGEVDRMPFEELNDIMERIIPVQGAGDYHVEWDSTARQGRGRGKLRVTHLHPKQVIPQPGVYTGVEDMDYLFLILPQTKEYIRRRYGVSVEDQSEEFPDVKAAVDALEEAKSENDMVSQIIAYFRSESGAIGRVSWVGDIPLEYTEDYQARHLMRCDDCGKIVLSGDGVCESCGSSHVSDSAERFEERYEPLEIADGIVLKPDMTNVIDPEPLRIPNYVPDVYPVVHQKNISEYGRFLGASDVDKIESLQNMVNRLECAIVEKICEAGSLVSLPNDVKITTEGGKNMKVIRLTKPEQMNYFGVFNLQGDTSQDRVHLNATYEEMKQAIGITDSFLGRRDPTATSGVAKDFAAKQSAGRLESKSVCKASAFGKLYEVMFKFLLAYADHPVSVPYRSDKGEATYKEWNRYKFLRRDEFGELYWNDSFIFSCDSASSLATNREAMWQEIRGNYTSGAYGDPTSNETRLLFWQKMDEQHYPGAAANARIFREKMEEEARAQAMAQAAAQTGAMTNGINGMPGEAMVPPEGMPII